MNIVYEYIFNFCYGGPFECAEDPLRPGSRVLNSFVGWMVRHDPGFRHDPEIVAPLARHLCHSWCSSDALSYTRTLQLFKHLLAYPERKAAVSIAMLLQGPAGSLKSLVFELLGNGIVGKPAYLYLQGATRLEQQFNAFWQDKILAIIDELHAVDHKGELIQKIMDQIKSLVSGGDYLRENNYEAVLDRLLARLFMITNHELPLLLELDDRRIFALALNPEYIEAYPWDHDRLIELLTKHRDILALHVYHWIVNDVELDDLETMKAPPRSPWKAAIQRASQSPVLRWLQDVASKRCSVGHGHDTIITYDDFYKEYIAAHWKMRPGRDPPESRARFEAILFKCANVDVDARVVDVSDAGRGRMERAMKLNKRWWEPWRRDSFAPGQWMMPAPPPPPPPPPGHSGPAPKREGAGGEYHGATQPPDSPTLPVPSCPSAAPCSCCGSTTCGFDPGLGMPSSEDFGDAGGDGSGHPQLERFRAMSVAQVDAHMMTLVVKLRRARAQDVLLLLSDRHTGPIQLALAERGRRWGCVVHAHIGHPLTGASRQEHGNTCGYHAPADLVAFLRTPDGPWWRGPRNGWEPHQATLEEITETNLFLQAYEHDRLDEWPVRGELGAKACCLTTEDVFLLCGRAAHMPRNDLSGSAGFGGVMTVDLALLHLHNALRDAVALPGALFRFGAIANTAQSGAPGSHWWTLFCQVSFVITQCVICQPSRS